MENKENISVLQEYEESKDIQLNEEAKLVNSKKNIFRNKKMIFVFLPIILVIITVTVAILIAQLKFKVVSNLARHFKERHNFSIEMQDVYIGIGEEVVLSTSTKLFQKKVDNFEVISSDEEVVSIEGDKITGEKIGRATIYAKSGERTSYPINLECIIRVEDIILDKEKIEVSVGYPLEIKAEVYPENASYKNIEYYSSNEDIAIVQNGKIIGINDGECIITATDKTGQIKKDFEVIVEYIPVEGIQLDEDELEIGLGKKYVLYGKLYPEFASNTSLEWETSNKDIVSVEDGIIIANSEGEAVITVKASENKISKCTVKVVQDEKERLKKYVRGNNPLRYKPIDNAKEIISLERNDIVEVLKEYEEWIKVRTEDGSKVGYIQINECTKEKSYYIKDVPFIDQYELGYPTGCEAVSATMVAKYKGYNIEPLVIINNTPTDDRGIWTEIIEVSIEKEEDNNEEQEGQEDNEENVEKEVIIEKQSKEVTYGGNPFKVFVGHPSKNYDQGSYGCYAKPIIEALEKCYIKFKDISGCSRDELLKNIEEGNPVVVWGTYNGQEVEEKEEWMFPDGQEGSYLHLKGEHCMVLIGYDDDNVYLNDPIAGKDVSQPKSVFFRNWEKLYSQAIFIY